MYEFTSDASVNSSLSCLYANIKEEHPWSHVKAIVDKVHRLIYGQANFTDIKLVLKRNVLWFDAVAEYVSQLFEKCSD